MVGDIGEGPYTSGIYYVGFMAYGEVIPTALIAGMLIFVQSAEERSALKIKLNDGLYRVFNGNSSSPLNGTYIPSTPHIIHIELSLDARTYSACIDNKVLINNNTILTPNFEQLKSQQFLAPPTINEAFEMVYVVDDIRITK